MCGIVGVVGNRTSFPTNLFFEMRESIAHRGPDDAGVWESPSGTALLGSRRLAILDLSAGGHQPMKDETSNQIIVFNGEIYNYLELADDLVRAGCRFRTRSDTEVLLKSYQIWGTECLSQLNGMFAFAIWDERRQELFAARDRFGEKPFYFCLDQERELLAFASEIKALIAGRLCPPRPNHSAVYSYLTSQGIDSGFVTIFENLQALPASHALQFSWRHRSLKTWRYWDLDDEQEIRLSDTGQYADHFLEMLSDSVRIRLRSEVPIGSSLSGGLDSSAIVGLIRRNGTSGGQRSFSARFHEAEFDEGQYINVMGRWLDVSGHSIYPNPLLIPNEIELLTWHQDEPFYDLSVYAQWCVMRLAKERGVTVLLDGQGGDEVLAGYHDYFGPYCMYLLRRARLFEALYAIRELIEDNGLSVLPPIAALLLPTGLRSAVKGWLRPRALRHEFKSKWGHPPESMNRKYRNDVHQALYASITRTILPHLLRYADRNSMAFSREIRLPFLDHRLVQFLFTLPIDQKICRGRTKVVLRNAVSGIVPEQIRNRKDKMGFAPPEVLWLQGPLRSWVEGVFSSPEFRQREWWEPTIVDSVWNRFKRGEGGLHTSIWRWLSLEVWARTCLKVGPTKYTDRAQLAPTTAECETAA